MINLYVKQGSFRGMLLKALDDGSINTIDDLEVKLEAHRKKIQDNIIHAVKDRLVRRLRDDVTGLPAYQIAPGGRDYLAMSSPAPQQIEAADSLVIETPTPVREFDGGLEMAYTRLLVPPAAEEVASDCDPAEFAEKFFVVSQVGHLFNNFDEIRCLASAKSQALKAAKNEGMTFEVYRVKLVGFAFPPSSATWQDA
jgi:hypothetical protein